MHLGPAHGNQLGRAVGRGIILGRAYGPLRGGRGRPRVGVRIHGLIQLTPGRSMQRPTLGRRLTRAVIQIIPTAMGTIRTIHLFTIGSG